MGEKNGTRGACLFSNRRLIREILKDWFEFGKHSGDTKNRELLLLKDIFHGGDLLESGS